MQYERIEMFADLAIREAMKNIFASHPSGGRGAAQKGIMTMDSACFARRNDAGTP